MLQGTRKWEGWYLEGLDKFFSTPEEPVTFEYPKGNSYQVKGSRDVFNSSMFPLQRRNELDQMLKLASLISPKVVYEIGADKGGSVYLWACIPTVKRVIACEIGGIPYNEHFEKAFPATDFLWLPVSSYAKETVSQVRQWLGNDKIDMLFIDGDKGKGMFEKDFRTYLPMMSPRSIIFMHDINDDGPRECFLNVSKEHRHTRLINTEESVVQAVKELRGEPPKQAQDAWLRHWKGLSAGVGVVFIGDWSNVGEYDGT